jgi:diguanylate cyclase (GGDEF)-like protein/PAS domain S-box-containing protein
MDAIVVIAADGRILYANPATEGLFGHRAAVLRGRLFSELVPDPSPAFAHATRAMLARAAGERVVQLVGAHRSGRRISLEATLGEHVEDGQRIWTAVLRDVTQREQLLRELSQSEERYALAARGAGVGLWDWDLDGGSVYYSPRFIELCGVEPARLETTLDAWLRKIHPDDLPAFRIRLLEHIAGHTPAFECEHRMRASDGSFRWMRARGLAVRDSEGRATRMAGSQTDVTEQKRTEDQLTHGALHDKLTGLPNRALLCDRIGRCIARARRRTHRFAVLALDLDRMKLVNESFGHAAGDELLMDIARKLHACARPGDTVARVDGDQFAVLLDDLANFDEANEVAERIARELAEGTEVGDGEVVVTATIGIATNRVEVVDPDQLLRAADAAMYRAKEMGGARHEQFEGSEAPTGGRLRLLLEADLRRAVARGEVSVAYQPIVSLATGRIGGFEALARWDHPERGSISPTEFVPIAENAGILPDIEQHVLSQACQMLATWQREFELETPLTIAVNVSPRRFDDDRLFDEIEGLLAQHRLAPSTLKLEITESLLVRHGEPVRARLERLRRLGVSLSIDDFGTGYSSLSYLHELPVDTLKIDQTFIFALETSSDRAEVVRTIVALARHLGLEAVAEGVENAEQLARLREFGCEWAQGYFFARPLSAEAAAAHVRREIEVLDATRISGKLNVRRRRARRAKRSA